MEVEVTHFLRIFISFHSFINLPFFKKNFFLALLLLLFHLYKEQKKRKRTLSTARQQVFCYNPYVKSDHAQQNTLKCVRLAFVFVTYSLYLNANFIGNGSSSSEILLDLLTISEIT